MEDVGEGVSLSLSPKRPDSLSLLQRGQTRDTGRPGGCLHWDVTHGVGCRSDPQQRRWGPTGPACAPACHPGPYGSSSPSRPSSPASCLLGMPTALRTRTLCAQGRENACCLQSTPLTGPNPQASPHIPSDAFPSFSSTQRPSLGLPPPALLPAHLSLPFPRPAPLSSSHVEDACTCLHLRWDSC